MNEYVLSQEWKEILEVKQRRDRKLREDFAKKKK
jgi:predicted nucleic acid-binding Zn ribbon protein